MPPAYTDDERARGMRAMIVEGGFVRAMESFTGGVVLAGFALALGASNFEIGLIAAIPFLAQLAHIPAVALLERWPNRKPLTIGAAALARVLFLAMAALPFLALPFATTWGLVALLTLYAVLATLSGAAWQVWVRELVPREQLGRYFGRRFAILSVVGLVTLLAAGQFVTQVSQRAPEWRLSAFAALIALGGVLGLMSAITQVRAPSLPSPGLRVASFPDSLKRPLRDANYRRVLVFLGGWAFAANLALPFVSVLLLRDLGYGLAIVTGLAATSQLANVAGFRMWSPLTDRFGNKPVLALSASVFLVGMLVWALLPKEAGTGFLVVTGVIHIVWGFALAGLDVAGNGIVMKLAPEDESPSYLASASVVKAIAAGVAPLLAGTVATLWSGHELAMRFAWTYPGGERIATVLQFGPLDILFLASFFFGLYAVHRLLGFQEQGEKPAEEVMRALRREVSSPTSVAGMRQFAHVASYLVEAAYRFEQTLDVRRMAPPRDHEDDTP